jgi:hypothetical protein
MDDDIETINQVCPFIRPKVSQLIDRDRPRELIICSLMLICRWMTSRDPEQPMRKYYFVRKGAPLERKSMIDLENGGNIVQENPL